MCKQTCRTFFFFKEEADLYLHLFIRVYSYIHIHCIYLYVIYLHETFNHSTDRQQCLFIQNSAKAYMRFSRFVRQQIFFSWFSLVLLFFFFITETQNFPKNQHSSFIHYVHVNSRKFNHHYNTTERIEEKKTHALNSTKLNVGTT